MWLKAEKGGPNKQALLNKIREVSNVFLNIKLVNGQMGEDEEFKSEKKLSLSSNA